MFLSHITVGVEKSKNQNREQNETYTQERFLSSLSSQSKYFLLFNVILLFFLEIQSLAHKTYNKVINEFDSTIFSPYFFLFHSISIVIWKPIFCSLYFSDDFKQNKLNKFFCIRTNFLFFETKRKKTIKILCDRSNRN